MGGHQPGARPRGTEGPRLRRRRAPGPGRTARRLRAEPRRALPHGRRRAAATGLDGAIAGARAGTLRGVRRPRGGRLRLRRRLAQRRLSRATPSSCSAIRCRSRRRASRNSRPPSASGTRRFRTKSPDLDPLPGQAHDRCVVGQPEGGAERLEVRSGPSTRKARGPAAIPASVRCRSGLMFARHSVALARKKRCAGVRPSIVGRRRRPRARGRAAPAPARRGRRCSRPGSGGR